MALDLELTPELRRAGLAREVVRPVQEARKTSGLEVTDRIALRWHADGDLAAALRAHAATIGAEVLATAITEGEPGPAWVRDDDLGLSFAITRS